jgi:hypothetical protein
LSSMAALSSGACSRLRCRTAWRILRLRLGKRALDAVVAFSLPAFGEVLLILATVAVAADFYRSR